MSQQNTGAEAGPSPAQEARAFACDCQHGVLSTLSKRLEGFPFGSVSPFILDPEGNPIILISDLAEHSRNLQADPRCSLILQPFAEDMQSTGRITVIGHAAMLAADDKAALRSTYLHRFPQAADYFAMHDFRFWRIRPLKVRWIGGFGRIHWIDPEAWQGPNNTAPYHSK
jgi:putative heme iron utilization protein